MSQTLGVSAHTLAKNNIQTAGALKTSTGNLRQAELSLKIVDDLLISRMMDD